MAKSKYTIDTAIEKIERNGGKVAKSTKVIEGTFGLKVLGAVDFLVNYHGYRWRRGFRLGAEPNKRKDVRSGKGRYGI